MWLRARGSVRRVVETLGVVRDRPSVVPAAAVRPYVDGEGARHVGPEGAGFVGKPVGQLPRGEQRGFGAVAGAVVVGGGDAIREPVHGHALAGLVAVGRLIFGVWPKLRMMSRGAGSGVYWRVPSGVVLQGAGWAARSRSRSVWLMGGVSFVGGLP